MGWGKIGTEFGPPTSKESLSTLWDSAFSKCRPDWKNQLSFAISRDIQSSSRNLIATFSLMRRSVNHSVAMAVCVNAIIMVAWIPEILVISLLQSSPTWSMCCIVSSSFLRLTYSVNHLPLSDIILTFLIGYLDSKSLQRFDLFNDFKRFYLLCGFILCSGYYIFPYCQVLRLKIY